MDEKISAKFFSATLAKFESDRLAALAILEGLLVNSVSVAEHSNLVEDLCKATRALSEAEGAIATLKRNYQVE
jgi:hypothetical protein